jgi:cysteine desulfuration protein SufE
MTPTELPRQLATIRDDFLELEQPDRLLLLLEFANELPELPPRYKDHPDLFERVVECQSPVFIFVEVDDAGLVHLYATAPRESPRCCPSPTTIPRRSVSPRPSRRSGSGA